jgi:hypothetical protein
MVHFFLVNLVNTMPSDSQKYFTGDYYPGSPSTFPGRNYLGSVSTLQGKVKNFLQRCTLNEISCWRIFAREFWYGAIAVFAAQAGEFVWVERSISRRGGLFWEGVAVHDPAYPGRQKTF